MRKGLKAKQNDLNAAQQALTAAQHTLNNINSYDAVKPAMDADKAATKALEDAQAAVAEDNSEWNQEAEAAAQRDADTAAANLQNVEQSHNFVHDNADINNYMAALDQAKADRDAANKADADKAAADRQANDLKNAAQTALDQAQHQYQREISGYRHNPTHENALRVAKAKADRDAAKTTLDNMNNYDAYLAAKDNDSAKQAALEDAQAAVAQDNSEWNQEAEAAAERDANAANDALTAAKAKVQDVLDMVNSLPSLQQAVDDAQTEVDKTQNDIRTADEAMTPIASKKAAADKAYKDQLAYQKELEDGLGQFIPELNAAQDAVKAAQKKVDDTKNAITDADTDMTKIASNKAAADKAYNDQLAYQKELEDGLGQFIPELNAAQDAVKAAQKKVDDTKNAITDADTDMTKIAANKAAADKAYADGVKKLNDLEDQFNKVMGPQLEAAKKATADAQKAHDDAVNAQTAADDNLTKAQANQKAADDLLAAAKAARKTASDLVDEKVPSYIKHDEAGQTTDDNKGTDTPADPSTPADPAKDADEPAAAAKNAAAAKSGNAAASMTRAQYRAAQQNAAKKNALPQTGNNNGAAVAALGAVSAMLGFGLAAKKREF